MWRGVAGACGGDWLRVQIHARGGNWLGRQDGNLPLAGRRSEARRPDVQVGGAQQGSGSGAQMRIGFGLNHARGIWGQFEREGARFCGMQLGEEGIRGELEIWWRRRRGKQGGKEGPVAAKGKILPSV